MPLCAREHEVVSESGIGMFHVKHPAEAERGRTFPKQLRKNSTNFLTAGGIDSIMTGEGFAGAAPLRLKNL